MPLFMDVHTVEDAAAEDVRQAHQSDLEVQETYGVKYLRYWFNRPVGKVFCLVEAPDARAAEAVHREAHGLIAEKIIEVEDEVVEAFLGGGGESPFNEALHPDEPAGTLDGAFRTILFTDLVGSTAMTLEVGDEQAMEIVRIHNRIVRDMLAEHGGREVKHTGDGIMASFASTARAVQCALAVQVKLREHNETEPPPEIQVRMGLNAGEPVAEGDDLFGAAVQLAARLCDCADPGQILVSNVVADLCLGKDVHFEDRGEVQLKGFGRPVRARAVVADT